MRNLILAVLVPAVCMCQGGCVGDPPTGAAAQALDGSGHYYGSRIASDAFTNAATAVAFGPFAFVDETTATSESKVTLGYQQIATVIGATTLIGGSFTAAKAATFGTRVLTWHADAISNLSSSTDVLPFFVGNLDGDLATAQAPTGCSTQIGGNTFTGYVPEPKDPATEAFRYSQALNDQGLYLWCPGIVEIYRDSMGVLQGRKLSGGSIVSVSLSACNTSVDTLDVCIGKMLGTHKIALADKTVKTANHDMPSLDSIASTDANVTNATWVFNAPVNVVKKNSLTDMNLIWNRIRDGGAGQAAALADLQARGASAP